LKIFGMLYGYKYCIACNYSSVGWPAWHSGSVICHVNEVTLR